MPSKPIRPATSPATTPAPDPVLETQVFWGQYKTPILLGLLLALCALAIVGGYRLYTTRRDTAAAAMLASAREPQDYQKLLQEYPDSASAPGAALLLADEQRKQQKFAEANATLENFLKANPKHELLTTAQMAMAANMESAGKTDDALLLFRRIAAEHPRDFNAPLALLAEVPLLKQKNQIEEARRVCETVLTQYRESYASQEATQYLRTLKPAVANTPAASAAPAISASAASAAAPSVSVIAGSPTASAASPTP